MPQTWMQIKRQIQSEQNKSERPVDALAVKKYQLPTDNFKSRDASASKK